MTFRALILAAALLVTVTTVQAQTVTVLHNFGSSPSDPLGSRGSSRRVATGTSTAPPQMAARRLAETFSKSPPQAQSPRSTTLTEFSNACH